MDDRAEEKHRAWGWNAPHKEVEVPHVLDPLSKDGYQFSTPQAQSTIKAKPSQELSLSTGANFTVWSSMILFSKGDLAIHRLLRGDHVGENPVVN